MAEPVEWPQVGWAVRNAEHYGFDDYPMAVQTHEGSVVANVMLRQLRQAMGLSDAAQPITPRELWDQTLAAVRAQSGRPE